MRIELTLHVGVVLVASGREDHAVPCRDVGRLRADADLPAHDSAVPLLERDELRLRLLSRMETLPILLAPVCTSPAFRHEDVGWGSGHAGDYLRTMTYCQHYNLLGNPAAVVPVGRSPEGLPIGVQVIGRPFKEEEVLAVAAVIDEQFGWNSFRKDGLCKHETGIRV